MDVSCNCFGVATAARVPVKRYNLLVPDVFPVVEPPADRPLGITIERKIKKLAEYLEKNEHRAPKVSRRLQRRLYHELAGRHYGYVKLAVATYQALLLSNRPEKSNLLANELVVRTVVKRRTLPFGHKVYLSFREPHLGSAVGLLLTHDAPQLRKLGVELLIDFIKRQHTSDYVPQLEAFVPLLCDNAKPRESVAAGYSRVTSAPAGGTPPSPTASPSPSSGGTRRARRSGSAGVAEDAATEEQWAQLRAACLRALLEHLRFCARLSYVSYHLHTITFAVLECVEAAAYAAPQGRYLSPRAALDRGINPVDSISRGSISHAVGASPPDVAALLVFEELAHMTRDAAEGKKVLEFVMRFLDHRGRWLGSPVVDTAVAVVQAACQQEHQRYLLYSTLLRHVAAAETLTPAERSAVLVHAVEEGRQLEAGLAAPALLLALRELPAVIASHAGAREDLPPMPVLAPPQLPPAGPAAQTAAAAAAAAAQAAAAADAAAATAFGTEAAETATMLAADAAAAAAASAAAAGAAAAAAEAPGSVQQLELAKLPPISSRPVSPATARGAPVDLQRLVLEAMQQLAVRVEDSGQLLEAIGSALGRLRGAAPISTAALQCCVAAAAAMQHLAPRAVRGPGTAPRGGLSSLLLQELAGVVVNWGPQQRLLAHQLVLALLPAAVDGLKEQQAAVLLSAVWHEAAMGSNPPAAYVAMDCLLRALLGAAPAATLPQAVGMLAALQLDVLRAGGTDGVAADDGRLAGLRAAQCCALLCVCSSALHALSAQLGQPALQQLAVPGCDAVLQQVTAAQPHGLLLRGQGDSNGLEASSAEASAARQQFWLAPALALAFEGDEEQRAAAFLAQWRSSTSSAQLEAGLAAALAVPLFKQAEAEGPGFRPIPVASLMPRMMQQGAPVLGSLLSNGSSGEGESRRAQRLRSVYRHMRQISLCDGDRAVLATISQESASEEPATAALQLRGLGLGLDGAGEGGAGAAPASVDDVLAEVDAALAEAEAALERGRSPSPPGWPAPALGGGSSSISFQGDASPPPPSSGGKGGAALGARPTSLRSQLSSLR